MFNAPSTNNNNHAAVAEEGYKYADHTMVTLSEHATMMLISKREHIDMLERAYMYVANNREKSTSGRNLFQKLLSGDLFQKLLSIVPSYSQYPTESLASMAHFCRRILYKQGDVVVKESDDAETVLYIMHGQCRIVKDCGKPGERTMNVLRRGACVGDWGVVNGQVRMASCVAVGDVEVLTIGKFNFKATVDQLLLARLLVKTEGTTEESAKEGNIAVVVARNNALRAPSPIREEASFELISRRDMRRAVAQM